MKNGIKIQNISAVRLYEYVVGDRNTLTRKDGVLPNSILTDYLVKQKIVKKDAEFTKELVMVNFDYDYLEDAKISNEITVRHSKPKTTKEEIRTILYKDGFDLEYMVGSCLVSTETGEVVEKETDDSVIMDLYDTIHYVSLYRTNNKAKQGGDVFINEEYAKDVDNYMCMGMKTDKIKDGEPTKLVELLAYKSLIASGCTDSVRIKSSEILILDDVDSSKSQKIESVELDEKALVQVIKKMGTVKNTLFDGQALIDDSLFTDKKSGMMVLRNHLFKACGFRTDIQLFMKDWCKDHNKNYETYQIKDKFGHKRYVKNIKMITTTNATKWLKFKYLFKDEKDICDYWFNYIKEQTDSYFGIVKTDHPSKYGDYQRMSYQMSNDLPMTYEQTGQLFDYSIKYIEQIKNNTEIFMQYLKDNADEVNGYEMTYELIHKYPTMIYSELVNKIRTDITYDLTQELLNGKAKVVGDNLTVCGNPYALLLHSVGQLDKKNPIDKCFAKRKNCIEVYTTRFEDGEYLAGFRSPNNSPNNVCYYQNKRSDIMKRYFKFSPNIMAVNGIKTDVQDRNCGEDYDADFNLVTNNKIVVKCAKECIKEFHTMVNNIPSNDDLKYEYSIEKIAEIDNKIAKSGVAIGESSNLAQLALSYYYDEKENEAKPEKMKEMKEVFVEMSIIAQIAIDSAKRTYKVDYEKEIRDNHFTSEYPRFFINIKDDLKILKGKKIELIDIDESEKELNPTEYNKKVKFNKAVSKIVTGIKCPMEYVQDIVNVAEKEHCKRYDDLEYISEINIEKSDYRQINRIIKLVNSWSNMTQTEIITDNGKTYFEYQNQKLMDEIITRIQSMKIKPATMNRAIRHIFGSNIKGKITKLASKNKKKLLMCLYKSQKKLFLEQFQDVEISEKDKKIDKNANINIA